MGGVDENDVHKKKKNDQVIRVRIYRTPYLNKYIIITTKSTHEYYAVQLFSQAQLDLKNKGC